MAITNKSTVVLNAVVEANVTEALKALDSLGGSAKDLMNVLKSVADGRDFTNYWKEVTKLATEATEAYKNFLNATPDNKTNAAEEYIKTLNAFTARGGDVKEFSKNFGEEFSSVTEEARNSARAIVESFNADAMKSVFASMDSLKEKGIDVTKDFQDVFGALRNGAQNLGLKEELERVTTALAEAEEKLKRLEGVIADGVETEEIKRLKQEIDSLNIAIDTYKKAIAKIGSRGSEEFGAFLTTNHIDKSSESVKEYFDKIKSGSITAGQAITDFKSKFSHLLDGGGSGVGASGASGVVGQLQGASETIEALKSVLASSDFSGGTGRVSLDINALITQLQELSSSAPGIQTGVNEVCDSLKNLLTSLTTLEGNGLKSAETINNIVSSFNVLANTKVRSSSFNEIINTLNSIVNIGNRGEVFTSWMRNIDFTKFSDIKVTKARSENVRSLIDGLAKGSEINVSNLEKVTKLNFDNLKGLKFDKESLAGLAELANVTDKVQALQNMVEEHTGKSMDEALGEVAASKKLLGDPSMIETYRNKLIQLNQAITTGYDNLRRWTAGESSYKAYEGQVKQLESLYDRLKDITRGQYDSQYKAIQAQMSENIKDMSVTDTRQKVLTQDTKEYTDALRSLETLKKTAAGDDKYTGMILSLSAKLKTEKMTVKDFANELSKLRLSFAEGKNSGDLGRKILGDDIDAYTKKAKEIIGLVISAKANMDKWSAASTGTSKESYEQYERDIEALRSLSETMAEFTVGNVDEQIALITTDMKECELAIRDAGEAMKLPSTIDVGTAQYKSAMSEVASLQEKITLNATKWSAAETGASKEAYQNYVAQKDALDNINKALQTGVLETNDYKEAINDVKDAMDRASNAIKIAGEDHQAAALISKDDPNTVRDYYNALEKTDNLIKQITQNTNKWTAAEKGQSRDAYATYKSLIGELEQLQNKVKSGTTTQEEFNNELSRIKSSAAEASKSIAAAKENTSSFGTLMDRASVAINRFVITYLGIRQVIRYARQMVQTSMEIESAMNRIQIITGATDKQMQSFFEVASKNAKELGKSIQDVAASIETFTRLGYNMTDASTLSKYATIMSNVADTTTDAATTGLTSIIKGYGLNVADVEHVTDVLVQVGQKYAISAEELMEAFSRGGAAMAASGTSFEQSAALFAATNAALQNASITGTMWKTNYCLYVQKCAYRTYLIAGNA